MSEKNHWGLPNIVIPSEVLFHPTLTLSSKVLFGFLRNLTQTEKGCYATNNYLGMLIGTKKRAVQDCISSLAKENFVTVELIKRPDGTTERRIHIRRDYEERYRSLVVAGNKMIYEEGFFDDETEEEIKHLDVLESAYTRAAKSIGGGCIKEHGGVQENAHRSKTIRSKTKESKTSLSENKNKIEYPTIVDKLERIMSKHYPNNILKPNHAIVWDKSIKELFKTWKGTVDALEKMLLFYYKNFDRKQKNHTVIQSGAALCDKISKLEMFVERNAYKEQQKGYDPNYYIKEQEKEKPDKNVKSYNTDNSPGLKRRNK